MNEHIGRAWPEMLQAERDFRTQKLEAPEVSEVFKDFLDRNRRVKTE